MNKTVKLIATKAYQVEMLHLEDGTYQLTHTINGVMSNTAPEAQYEIVSAQFDQKVSELDNLQIISTKH